MRQQERMDLLACSIAVAGVVLLAVLIVGVIYWLI